MQYLFRYILVASTLVLGIESFGQDALLRKAERLYARYSYDEAITWYEKAFAEGTQDPIAARHLAESYRRVRQLGNSEKWYALVVSGPGATAADYYGYADALRANQKYHQADSVMTIYALLEEDGRAEALSHSADMYSKLLVDPLVEGEVIELPWNTPGTDMCPTLLKDELVFASSRTPSSTVQRTHAWDGQPLLNLYIRKDSTITLFKGEVNTRYHESNATFSADGTEMYFTRNNYLDGKSEEGDDGINNLMIYRAELVNGSWVRETGFEHNDPSFSTGHPSLSADGRALYFASNRPGGHGGVDIWKCEREPGGAWKTPVNMGPQVNTEGDEMFPYVHGDHALFFSSDGHAGLGGLDILLSWLFKEGAQEPQNMGAPVNSAADDMSLVLSEDSMHGYFASDRIGGQGGTDIYELVLDDMLERKVRVGGRMISQEDTAPLAHIPVRLLRPDRSLLAQQLTAHDGSFEFLVVPQSMTISAGIPGGSDMELPMDEHLLLAGIGDMELGSLGLSSIVDVPLAVHVVDMNTGLPAKGAHVHLIDPNNGDRVVVDGTADDGGVVVGQLPHVMVGRDIPLRLDVSIPGRSVLSVDLTFRVEDGTQHAIDQHYDMGNAMLAVIRAKQANVFRYLEDNTQAEGNVWAGRVVNTKDHGPLASVPVALLDLQRRELAHALTDVSGSYCLRSADVPNSIIVAIPGGHSIEVSDISPFGDQQLSDAEIQGVQDLHVHATLTDAVTTRPLDGVQVSARSSRDGRVLFQGITDAQGVIRGTLKGRRFGTLQDIDLQCEKTGYLPRTAIADFDVLSFEEKALGGESGFALMPATVGLDVAKALDLRPIFFGYNDVQLQPSAMNELDLVAQIMLMEPGMRVQLRSHTDSRGSAAFNQFLSQRRAEAVKAYLVEQGVDASRLTASGIGEREPVNGCSSEDCSEAEHLANRRTEFLLMACPGCGTASAR